MLIRPCLSHHRPLCPLLSRLQPLWPLPSRFLNKQICSRPKGLCPGPLPKTLYLWFFISQAKRTSRMGSEKEQKAKSLEESQRPRGRERDQLSSPSGPRWRGPAWGQSWHLWGFLLTRQLWSRFQKGLSMPHIYQDPRILTFHVK